MDARRVALRAVGVISDVRETAWWIARVAAAFCRDCEGMKDWSPTQVYRRLKMLPFRPDPKGLESLQRPLFTLDPHWEGPRDCDDKTLAFVAWGFVKPDRRVRFRICRDRNARSWHHVYPGLLLPAGFYPLDPTFSDRGEAGRTLYDEADVIDFDPWQLLSVKKV